MEPLIETAFATETLELVCSPIELSSVASISVPAASLIIMVASFDPPPSKTLESEVKRAAIS